MARNHRIRFGFNNLAEETTPTVSSEDTNFPFSNALNEARYKQWQPTGAFEITTSNQKLYLDDGSAYEITLDVATYTTADLLATEIQTKINASGIGVTATVTYNSTTRRFDFSFTGSVTMSISNQTNAVWDTIGFVVASDIVGTSASADEIRIHTSEKAVFDFGYPAEISMFTILPPSGDTLGLTGSATVTLKANNVNDFTTPQYTKTATVTDSGVFEFLDTTDNDDDLPAFRYWQMEMIDRTNPLGTDSITVSHVYLGTYLTVSSRNVQSLFDKSSTDPSIVVQSDSGAKYYDLRTKFKSYQGMEMLYLEASDRREVEDFIQQVGITTPFYLVLDPTQIASASSDELLIYGTFTSLPAVTHVKKDVYSVRMDVEEVL